MPVKQTKAATKAKPQARRSSANGHGAIVVPITTLEPEPFELRKPVPIVVQQIDDQYVASFFDANINASGETQQDAVANLKDIMVILFQRLSKEKKLGKGPSLQRSILARVTRRRRRPSVADE